MSAPVSGPQQWFQTLGVAKQHFTVHSFSPFDFHNLLVTLMWLFAGFADGDDSDDDGDDSNGGDGGGGGATLPSTPCRQSNGTGLHTQFRRVQKLTKTIIDFFRWKKYYNSIMLLFPGLRDGDNWRKRCKIVPSSFQIHANSAISRQKRETSIHWWWHYY